MPVAEFTSLKIAFQPVFGADGRISYYQGKGLGTEKPTLTAADAPPGDPVRLVVLSTAIPFDDCRPSGEGNGITLPEVILAVRGLGVGTSFITFETREISFSLDRLKEDRGSGGPETQDLGLSANVFWQSSLKRDVTKPGEVNSELVL
jgi:hypothetical protein